MLNRSFTEAELQLNQLKHKQLPPQIDFDILHYNTLKPVHYLIKHEEVLQDKIHIQYWLIMVQINFQFALAIKEMTLLSNL